MNLTKAGDAIEQVYLWSLAGQWWHCEVGMVLFCSHRVSRREFALPPAQHELKTQLPAQLRRVLVPERCTPSGRARKGRLSQAVGRLLFSSRGPSSSVRGG
jgi:hypothetical protein